MNLKQLRFACAVSATRSFTAAAADCCVTQPTLSNSIALLEAELGEPIFQRSTRKVTLTPFGTHLMPYINEVLSANEALIFQANAFLKPENNLIRIGTSPLISASLLRLIIEPFQLQNPDVDVVLREMNMADLSNMLNKGFLDFVFGVADIYKEPREKTFLYNEPLLFIPRGEVNSSLQNERFVKFKDIANETYVMVPDACGLSKATRALFRSHRRKLLEYSGEAMSYQVLSEWAALGIGAAILPKSKITDSRQSVFTIIDKVDVEVTIDFEATWIHKGLKTPYLNIFAEHLRTVVPRIVAGHSK